MKRINKKVSELVSDLTMYQREYNTLVAKEKYNPNGLTDIEKIERYISMYKALILEQRLYLEYGIAENGCLIDKHTMKKYYGEDYTIEQYYNYEELEDNKKRLIRCEEELKDFLRKQRKQSEAKAVA